MGQSVRRPLLGAHLSIAGGLHKAVDEATALGMDTVQIFTKNASQWAAKPLTDEAIAAFRDAINRTRIRLPTAHDSYLINLGSSDEALWQKSVDAMTDEVRRADMLGLSYLVSHPGAHLGLGEEVGLQRVVAGLDEVHSRLPDATVKILIETTAGMGTTLGWKFEHLDTILTGVRDPDRLGVCLDTCHIFAAGYPLGTDDEYDDTMREFDRIVGLKQIRCFHLNDSVKGLGSRVDRHAGIGLGKIGENAFRRLVTDRRFRDRPMILETPKEDDEGKPMDAVNLGKLREFLGL